MPNEELAEQEPEPEPTLVERPKEEARKKEWEDRPTDYALGRELTELRQDVDALKTNHESLSQELREAMSGIPSVIQESLERAIQSLQADDAEAAPETNPVLTIWEKMLLGRK